jgi:hypothetical protein
MKAIKVLFILLVILGSADNCAKAQADVYKGGLWMMTLYTAPDGNTYGPYYSRETLRVSTPSGNIMITTLFLLDIDDPRVPENGVNKIPSIAYYYNKGEYYETLDGEKIITADGMAKSVYHVNGQQEIAVLKDDGCMPLPCTNEIACGSAVKEIKYWNGNFHMNFYGAYIGAISGFHYSISGICNERIQYPGKIINVPLVVKMEGKVILIVYMSWGVNIDSNGEITLDDEVPGSYFECK